MAAFFGRLGGWLYQRPYLLIALTYLMWSANIVAGRHAAGHIPPVALSVWRWGFAGVVLLPFAWPHLKTDWAQIRAHAWLIVILAITGTTGYAIAAYGALQYTQAINGLLIQCTMPMAVGFMSYVLFGDRLNGRQMFGVILSFAGVVWILTRGDLAVLHAIAFNIGDVFFIAATLIFASYSALVKRRPKIHPLSFLTITSLAGTICVLPLYAWEIATAAPPQYDMKTFWIVAYIAIFPTILAYPCFNRGVEAVGPNRAAAMYPLIIVFGSVIAILLLGEHPQSYHAVGTALIVCGVLLATRQGRAAS